MGFTFEIYSMEEEKKEIMGQPFITFERSLCRVSFKPRCFETSPVVFSAA